MTTFTDGILVLVEGNQDGREWFPALGWQAKKFIDAMCFDQMKTMCYPNPIEETEPFTQGDYQYQFVILNDWGPCYLRNITTGKEREIKYLRLSRSKTSVPYTPNNNKPSKVKIC